MVVILQVDPPAHTHTRDTLHATPKIPVPCPGPRRGCLVNSCSFMAYIFPNLEDVRWLLVLVTTMVTTYIVHKVQYRPSESTIYPCRFRRIHPRALPSNPPDGSGGGISRNVAVNMILDEFRTHTHCGKRRCDERCCVVAVAWHLSVRHAPNKPQVPSLTFGRGSEAKRLDLTLRDRCAQLSFVGVTFARISSAFTQITREASESIGRSR